MDIGHISNSNKKCLKQKNTQAYIPLAVNVLGSLQNSTICLQEKERSRQIMF